MEKKQTSALTKRYVLTDPIKLREKPFGDYQLALQKLNGYLAEKHKKSTSEREYILDTLYRTDRLVDPTTLHTLVCEHHGLVSIASIYNTLLLFQEIGVARKIMLLNGSLTFYERSIGNPAHPIAVCPHCKTIWSLPPMDFVQQFNNLVPTRFSPLGYSMIIDGICQKCLQKQKKEEKAQEMAYQKEQALKNKRKNRKTNIKKQKRNG